MAGRKDSNKQATQGPVTPKWQTGEEFVGELPAYIVARELAIKTELKIVRFIEKHRKSPSRLRSLYIGTKEQLLASGMFKHPEHVQFPIGRNPTAADIEEYVPTVRWRGVSVYSNGLFCIKTEEEIPQSQEVRNGITKFLFYRDGELDLSIEMGRREQMIANKVAEERWFPEQTKVGGGQIKHLGDNEYWAERESTLMPNGEWIYAVHHGHMAWFKQREERSKEEERSNEPEGPKSADEYRALVLRWWNLIISQIEDMKKGMTGPNAHYRLSDETLEAMRDCLVEANWEIRADEIRVRRLDLRSSDEKQRARHRAASAERDGGFQAFLRSCISVPQSQDI